MSWLREKTSPFQPCHTLAYGTPFDAFSYRLSDLTGTGEEGWKRLNRCFQTACGTTCTLGFRRRVLEIV